jgi:hypothetical protein
MREGHEIMITAPGTEGDQPTTGGRD